MKYIPCEWVENEKDSWVLLSNREMIASVFREGSRWLCLSFRGRWLSRKTKRGIMRLVEKRLGVITQEESADGL